MREFVVCCMETLQGSWIMGFRVAKAAKVSRLEQIKLFGGFSGNSIASP